MASLVLTINDADVQRVQDAFGDALHLDGPASAEEIRQFLLHKVRVMVRNYERTVSVPADVDVS
jgi:hypothetical protein